MWLLEMHNTTVRSRNSNFTDFVVIMVVDRVNCALQCFSRIILVPVEIKHLHINMFSICIA